MKTYAAGIIVILILFLSACKREKKGDIFIEGIHPTVKNEVVYLVDAEQSQGYNAFYKALDSAFADKDGRYVFKTEVRGNGFYQIRDQQQNMLWINDIYLRPGDSVELTETNISTSSGNITAVNRFPATLQKAFPHENYKWITEQPSEFKKIAANRYKAISDFTSRYFDTLDVDEKVVECFKMQNRLSHINLKLDYLEHHNLYAYGQWFPMPLDSMAFKKGISHVLADTSWFFLNEYMECVQKYTTAKYHTHFFNPLDANADTRVMLTKKAIIDTMFTGIRRDIALATIANNFWKYLPAMQEEFYKDGEEILQYFDKVKTGPQFFDYYEDLFNDYLRIKPGSQAPVFALPDSTGNELTLNTFYGNYVYITFWNTMNRPFVSNLEAYRELEEALGFYDNVVLLYVALQPDDEDAIRAWKYFINTYPFGGRHLVARGGMGNSEVQPYMIEAMPASVLIRPDGRIITPRAPGPDDLPETLLKLMGRNITISATETEE